MERLGLYNDILLESLIKSLLKQLPISKDLELVSILSPLAKMNYNQTEYLKDIFQYIAEKRLKNIKPHHFLTIMHSLTCFEPIEDNPLTPRSSEPVDDRFNDDCSDEKYTFYVFTILEKLRCMGGKQLCNFLLFCALLQWFPCEIFEFYKKVGVYKLSFC